MAANVNKWSETAASNSTADPAINWAEGQAPSTVNDSARQMMAAVAADRDDTRGSLTFSGTSSALTLATNSVNATYQNGLRVSGKLASAFAANATLNVDSIGAKNIYRYLAGGVTAIQPTDGVTGQHVTFEYEAALNSAAGGWVLVGSDFGNGFRQPDFWVRDEKASGTASALGTGAYAATVLNTVKRNVITGASLASNQFTLPIGTYYARWRIPYTGAAGGITIMKSKIFNVTATADVEIGSNGRTNLAAATAVDVLTTGEAIFTIAVSTVFELRRWLTTSAPQGQALSLGDIEVYADLEIWKVG